MHRIFIFTLFAALLVIPGVAYAGDSLLSGYGGPGGGEQVVLGSKLLPPGGGSGGGIRSRATAPRPVVRSVTLPSNAPVQGSQGQAPTPSGTGRAGGSTASSGSPKARSTHVVVSPGAALTARPALVRSTADAGSPLGGGEILLGALGALALVLTALGTRRLVSGPGQGLQT